MKKLIDVTIEFDRNIGALEGGKYFYNLKFNGVWLSNCCLMLKTKCVIANFDQQHLDILGIKNDDFESYKRKFEDLGFDLYKFED